MALLAVVSLSAIPAMVDASGPVAWGMIALGQSIGGIGASVISYGWSLSGPAFIARAGERERQTEYAESVSAKLLLFVPVAAAAGGIAWLVGRDFALFAVAGAVSMAATGLTANWYFIGMVQPYRLLVAETAPRVLGTIIGIVLMSSGASALVGVLMQLAGMFSAFLISSIVISAPSRRLGALERRPVLSVLVAQRLGVSASVVSSLYVALPIVVVSLVAPTVQPVYAVVEKVQRQVVVGLGPFVTVLQGWIPRGRPEALHGRVRQGLVAAVVSSAVLAVFMLAVAPELIGWLGGGQITPSFLTLAIMSLIIGTSILEAMVSRACLSALGRLDLAARSTAIGSIVGLPLVGFGAIFLGAPGALGGILVGLAVRLSLELIGLFRSLGTGRRGLEDIGPEPIVG